MTHQIGIYDHTTGEQSTREMTADEVANFEAGKLAKQERENAKAQVLSDKLTILSELGLTKAQAIILGLLPDVEQPTKVIG